MNLPQNTRLRRSKSAPLNATGAAQTWAHGLGSVPPCFAIEILQGDDGAGAPGNLAPTVTWGIHTATNLEVTVTAGAIFNLIAWF